MGQTSTNTIISTVAVDLGGKSTGVLLTQGDIEASPHQHAKSALTLVFPEAGLNLSQQARLAKRHQRRGFKRRKLSKRLLQLILRDRADSAELEFFADFNQLRTFLNRRGYTYLSLEDAEEQEAVIGAAGADDLEMLISILPAFEFNTKQKLTQQLVKTAEKPIEWYQTLAAKIADILQAKALPEFSEKNRKKSFEILLREIRNYCDAVLKSEKEGHKTRSEYLENIRHDLAAPEFTAIVSRFKLTAGQLTNLIGHIANLQLRVLRRYFNDVTMAEEDYWSESRLQSIFVRYLQSWHLKHNDPYDQNRTQLQQAIAKSGLLTTFFDTNPVLSIPPFEDPNNRRPPKCRSLHLDGTALEKDFPQWRAWVEAILNHYGNLYELSLSDSSVADIEDLYRKAAPATSTKKTKSRDAILLQRILDRSKDIDDFNLRTLCRISQIAPEDLSSVPSEGERKRFESGRNALVRALGSNGAATAFISLCDRYYDEVENAKRGLWLPEGSANICYTCDAKPRQKKNLKHALIGHIVGADLQAGDAWQVWEDLYYLKGSIGRSSIASSCKNIEETRKDIGDQFHLLWNRQRFIRKRQPAVVTDNAAAKRADETSEQKEFRRVFDATLAVAEKIATHFQHDEKASEKYRNPYSLAQIYNIMDGDIGGFYSTCPACTYDNFWRSSRAAASNEQSARAVRLSADTMRPFDGFLARYLERIADKISREKWQQLKTLPAESDVSIALLLEQNRFRFNADLSEIKDAARKKQAKEKMLNAQAREQDKSERIRKASHGICPYTGEALGNNGEFDHILPRSFSKSAFGIVFNSEMNLIYCTSTGNRRKADKRYRLNDLHANYLQKVYKTSDLTVIKAQIAKTLSAFNRDTPVYFQNLEPAEQRDFRHALFDDEMSRRVQPLIHAEYKMRVSGLQGYLARMIYQKLLDRNEQSGKKLNLAFRVFGYDAGQLHHLRENLAVHNVAYSKPDDAKQAPGSHVIDATMAWAHALERGDVPGLPAGLAVEGDALEELLPDNLRIVSLESQKQYRRKRPQSQPIFKDTIYAERYLSLIVTKKECGFGYNPKQWLPIDEKHAEAVFALLRPFIVFKGEAAEKQLSEYRALLDQKKKYVYFNINRQLASRFQKAHAYAPELTTEQKNQFALLTGLRYFTLKKDAFRALADPTGKAVPLADKVLDKFSTKVDISLDLIEGKRAVKIAGTVPLPQRDAWVAFVGDKLVKDFTKKGKKWAELPESEERALKLRVFPQTIENPHKHRGVRKVYSLPMPDGPSGGFRLHRKHGADEHFQVQAKDGATYAGFSVENDQVNFSQGVMMPFLRQNKLIPIDGHAGSAPAAFVYMDAWREVPLEKVEGAGDLITYLAIAPNSDSRVKIRIGVRNRALGGAQTGWHLSAPGILNVSKFSDNAAIKKIEQKLASVLVPLGLQPRDGKTQLVAVDGESTTVEFFVQSTNAQHRAWYNEGTTI